MTREKNYAGGRKPKTPNCPCGRSLATGPKAFYDGTWHCEECTYKHDYPEKEVVSEPRRRALPLQEEKLFEISPRRDD